MQRTIKKAKIKGRSLEVELTETVETENGPVTNEVTMKCAGIVHDDLIDRFNKLVLHMLLICDLRKAEKITTETFELEDLEEFSDYNVKGFTIAGEDESEGVVIIGSRRFNSGKVLNITTPFTRFTDENDPYLYEGELYNDLQACIYEVEQYLYEGKFAVKQLDLDFDDTDGQEVEKEVA